MDVTACTRCGGALDRERVIFRCLEPGSRTASTGSTSENSMELLPVEESACYRCRRPRIGEIEPFTVVARGRTGRPARTAV